MNDVLFKIGNNPVTIGSVLWGVLIFIITKLLLLGIGTALRRRSDRNKLQDPRLISDFQLFKYVIWVTALILALEVLGSNLTFLIAGSGALLVGLGLGLEQTFNAIISGIIILLECTIRVGDVLEMEDLVGRVTEINLRTSTIYSRDGMNVIVPNHRSINENVVNWSHNALETRFRSNVGLAYDRDDVQVRGLLTDRVKTQKDVITDDPLHLVEVRLKNFGDVRWNSRSCSGATTSFTLSILKAIFDLRYAKNSVSAISLFRSHSTTYTI